MPFSFSLQSKIVWETIQISRWLFISRNGLDSFTEDRLEFRIGDQSLSALSVVLDNMRQSLLHTGDSGQHLNHSPGALLVPVCLLDFPSCLLEGPTSQTSGQGALGMVGAEASPHSSCTALPSPTTFPFAAWKTLYDGKKQSPNTSWFKTLLQTASTQPYQF